MLIGDWDRHEDQWGWGELKKDNQNDFCSCSGRPRPGLFHTSWQTLDAAIYGSGIRYFQSFKDHISNVKTLNYEERGLDRVFTNELTKAQWVTIAKALQRALTDNIIEAAVKKLPPEVFSFSGKKINRDLKSRRNQVGKLCDSILFVSF